MATRGIIKSIYSKEQKAFCDLMATVRKEAGLTQQELAIRLKRPQSFVAKYEGGERRLDVVEFIAVAKAIGTDPIAILRSFLKTLP